MRLRVPWRASEPVEDRAGVAVEERGLPSYAGFGYNVLDWSAIPPNGYGKRVWAGVNVTPDTAIQIDVVWAALRIVSTIISSLGDPYPYAEELTDAGVPYHKRLAQRYPILQDPFGSRIGGLTATDGRRQTIISMMLWGDAWWYTIGQDDLFRASTLEVLNPAALQIKDEDGQRKYLYGTGDNQIELDQRRLTRVPFLTMPGGVRGVSGMDSGGLNMALCLAALEWGARFFSQGASPSYLLSSDTKIGVEEAERIAQRFQVQHSGLTQAHLPVVAGGGLKVQPLSKTPDEAGYVGVLQAARSGLGAYFGVPPHFLGDVSQRANPYAAGATEEMMRQFLTTGLMGYITPLEEAYTNLLPQGVRAAFDEQRLQRPDAQGQALLITALRQTQVGTQNDIRTRILHWEPMDGGDELIAPLASNTAPSQTAPSQNGADPAEPADEAGSESRSRRMLDDPVVTEEELVRLVDAVLTREQASGDQQRALVALVQGASERQQTEMRELLAAVVEGQRVSVAGVVDAIRNQPAPVVTVAAPEVTVEQPAVNVENRIDLDQLAAALKALRDQKPPQVTVRPEISVAPADVIVNLPKRNVHVTRDERGRITGTEEE